MKKFVLIAALLFTGAAQAGQVDWQTKLENYAKQIETVSNPSLRAHHFFYTTAALTTCTLSAAVTGAAFIADSAPVTNIVAELIGNAANSDYKTYETLLSWETLAQTGTGLAGGGAVAVVETLQFVTLWLGGNEDQAWNQVKSTYASTIATANSVFADQGQCMMSLSKVLLSRKEMQKRGLLPVREAKPLQMIRP